MNLYLYEIHLADQYVAIPAMSEELAIETLVCNSDVQDHQIKSVIESGMWEGSTFDPSQIQFRDK